MQLSEVQSERMNAENSFFNGKDSLPGTERMDDVRGEMVEWF